MSAALTWLRGTEDVGEEMEELRKRMEHHDTVRVCFCGTLHLCNLMI